MTKLTISLFALVFLASAVLNKEVAATVLHHNPVAN